MLLGVCLVLIVLAVSAEDPKPCCVSDRLHGTMVQIGARLFTGSSLPHYFDNILAIDYDYGRRQLFMSGTARDPRTGVVSNLTQLQDYSNEKSYTVASGTCTVANLNSDDLQTPCLTGNYTYERTYTIGASTNRVSVNAFSQYQDKRTLYLDVTADDCTPVSYEMYGQSDDGSQEFLYAYKFSDIVQGSLSTTDPFVIPQECKTAPQPVG